MTTSRILVAFLAIGMLASCVSKKKFSDLQASYDDVEMQLQKAKTSLDDCNEASEAMKNDLNKAQSDLGMANDKVAQLQEDLDYMKKTNTNLLDRLADLSIVNKEGAESIRESLNAINQQSQYIENLNTKVQVRDSMNMALVMKLKRSLADVNDEDINVEVREGVVYVSISDKMLFNTASAVVSSKASKVLEKVAKVVNDHNDIDILVEGHTDNVPIRTDCVKDNWDLSVKRATAVVRKLVDQHDVDPSRLAAGGRGEYAPKESNETRQGRASNRRTEIIIVPKLDQFFNLAQPNE